MTAQQIAAIDPIEIDQSLKRSPQRLGIVRLKAPDLPSEAKNGSGTRGVKKPGTPNAATAVALK